MKKSQSLQLSEIAYNRLRSDIISCTIEPGSQISINYLTDLYDLGRSPINNALQKLMQEGLIVSVPRVGYFVTPISISDVKQIYEALLILEVNINALAAKNGAEHTLREILETSNFTYIYKDHESYSVFLEKNLEFHTRIADATGNARLKDLLLEVLSEVTRCFYLGLETRDIGKEVQKEHYDLAVAIYNRDVDLVKQLTEQQVMHSQEVLLEALSKIDVNRHNSLLPDLILINRNRITETADKVTNA